MGTWSESNSKDGLGTVVRRNFWLKGETCHPNVSIWEQTGARIYSPSSHRRLLASQWRGVVVYRQSRGAPWRWRRAPAGRGRWGLGLHSLRSACQQRRNPITRSGSRSLTTSPECWIMITPILLNMLLDFDVIRDSEQLWLSFLQSHKVSLTGVDRAESGTLASTFLFYTFNGWTDTFSRNQNCT